MLKKEVVAMFNEIIEGQDTNDKPLMRMAWNDLLDSLEKDSSITLKRANTWSKPTICN